MCLWWSLCTLYLHACQVSYSRRLRSLLYLYYVFRALINSLVCWSSSKWSFKTNKSDVASPQFICWQFWQYAWQQPGIWLVRVPSGLVDWLLLKFEGEGSQPFRGSHFLTFMSWFSAYLPGIFQGQWICHLYVIMTFSLAFRDISRAVGFSPLYHDDF